MRATDYTALNKRDDALGLVQAIGVLLIAIGTGASTLAAWRMGYPGLALLGLVAHGNVCSLFISAVHELSHGTVFATRALNSFFGAVYGWLNWMSRGHYMSTHASHHKNTLGSDDAEVPGACRALWLGTWVWSAVFNFPRLWSSARNYTGTGVGLHLAFAAYCLLVGWWELVVLVTLAPFWFGWLELAVNYPQHAGMRLDAADLRDSTRSLKLPGWLSFLHWRMEYHLEHHLYPNVPCYRLPALRAALRANLPPRRTLLQAWAEIWAHRGPGRCGHGPNPLQLFFQPKV